MTKRWGAVAGISAHSFLRLSRAETRDHAKVAAAIMRALVRRRKDRSPSGKTSVQLVTRDATAPHDSVISVHVGACVDEAYAEAKRRGYEIVHPLTEEAWGVRRFFVRAPDGNVINMVSHNDE